MAEDARVLDTGRDSDGAALPWVPGIGLIGAGYDPFGAYASIDSVRTQFFDWRNAPREELLTGGFAIPVGIDVQWIGDGQYAVQYGTSFESLRRQLASRANLSVGLPFFSSSFSTEFSSDQLTSTENEFTRIQETQRVWALRLTVTEAVRSLVKAPIKAALKDAAADRAAAARFFETHGSHILAGIVMGGRCVYAAVTDRTKLDGSTSVRRSAEIGFQFTRGSGSAGTGGGDETTNKSFQEASRTSYFVSGGDLGLHVRALGHSGTDLDALADWVSSVTAAPTLVDFHGPSPLIGVWTLCEDAAARDALKGHFDHWARERALALRVHPDFITHIKVVAGEKADVPAPPGYKMLRTDLNASAGGKFIYICYRTAGHADALRAGTPLPCITDLVLVSQTAKGPPAEDDGWTYDGHDLNEGAGGSYLYLGYRKEEYRVDPTHQAPLVRPVVGIKVVSGTSLADAALDDYERVSGDLNDGISGSGMYLFISRGPQPLSDV